jgi:predicted RNase H-like HicB family nuclease
MSSKFLAAQPESSRRTFQIEAEWDDEAGVWVVSSDDIPGLVTEAETIEEVTRKLLEIVPDLLELNGMAAPEDDGTAPLDLLIHSERRVSIGS